MKTPILKFASLNTLGTVLYVALVALFFSNTPYIFGNSPEKTILIPIAMLLLFVCSALITGLLVLGRPILWFLDGKKKEAVTLLLTTLGFLFLTMIIAFTALALSMK